MGKLSLFHQEEYRRLATEIIKDRELQFRLFWQSITVTAVIFSFCATILDSELWLHYPIVILAPHLILIPTATIILNRARTVNRKSAYLMVVFDHYADSHNWERDLSILRRMDNDEQPHRIPHRAATIRDCSLLLPWSSCCASSPIFFCCSPNHKDCATTPGTSCSFSASSTVRSISACLPSGHAIFFRPSTKTVFRAMRVCGAGFWRKSLTYSIK